MAKEKLEAAPRGGKLTDEKVTLDKVLADAIIAGIDGHSTKNPMQDTSAVMSAACYAVRCIAVAMKTNPEAYLVEVLEQTLDLTKRDIARAKGAPNT